MNLRLNRERCWKHARDIAHVSAKISILALDPALVSPLVLDPCARVCLRARVCACLHGFHSVYTGIIVLLIYSFIRLFAFVCSRAPC